MKTLHVLNQSPYNTQQFDRVLKWATQNDTLLLIEDAVYAISLKGMDQIKSLQNFKVFVLEADLLIRGLKNVVPMWMNVITDVQWVGLTAEHSNIISWD